MGNLVIIVDLKNLITSWPMFAPLPSLSFFNNPNSKPEKFKKEKRKKKEHETETETHESKGTKPRNRKKS